MDESYSWGEFYETTKNCSEYTEEIRKKFAVFEALDKATTLEEIRKIVKPLTEYEINWLNSPCLDGIVFSIEDPEIKLLKKEYLETFKYYDQKKLIYIHIAEICKKGFLQIAKYLVGTRKFIQYDLYTSLCAAVQKGYFEIVKLLLENGAEIRYKSEQPLRDACKNNYTEIATLLLKYGADVYDAENLMISCKKNYIEMTQLLLENKANIHVYHDRALITACSHNYVELTEILLKYGANIHTHDNFCLYHACNYEYIDMVDLLLKYKANIHTPDIRYIQDACIRHPKLIEVFVKHKINLQFLDCSLVRSRLELSKILQRVGANIYAKDDEPLFPPNQ